MSSDETAGRTSPHRAPARGEAKRAIAGKSAARREIAGKRRPIGGVDGAYPGHVVVAERAKVVRSLSVISVHRGVYFWRVSQTEKMAGLVRQDRREIPAVGGNFRARR